jgi:hypothetical protein
MKIMNSSRVNPVVAWSKVPLAVSCGRLSRGRRVRTGISTILERGASGLSIDRRRITQPAAQVDGRPRKAGRVLRRYSLWRRLSSGEPEKPGTDFRPLLPDCDSPDRFEC